MTLARSTSHKQVIDLFLPLGSRRQPDFKLKAPDQMSQRQLILRAMQDPKWIDFRRNWRRKKTPEADKEEKLKGKL